LDNLRNRRREALCIPRISAWLVAALSRILKEHHHLPIPGGLKHQRTPLGTMSEKKGSARVAFLFESLKHVSNFWCSLRKGPNRSRRRLSYVKGGKSAMIKCLHCAAV
jgi:hypothetical protein